MGAVGVLVPLLILLRMQYGWLVTLEDTSAIAHRAELKNYLEALATEVEYFYKTQAERALNIPASMFLPGEAPRAARRFSRKPVKGVRRFFLVSYAENDAGELFLWSPEGKAVDTAAVPHEVKALSVALAPWRMLHFKEMEVSPVVLGVDERDPDHRIILNPITDHDSLVVGVAGMVLDADYFRKRFLPGMIKKSLPHFFSESMLENLVVEVRDGDGRVTLATGALKEQEPAVALPMEFIFTEWQIGMHSGRLQTGMWARSSFRLNLALSLLLAVVLLGGVVVALRTVSREMRLSQMKADFVSNVSHELRTPLASIRVFGEFFRLGRVDEQAKMREYGEYIETESRRLTQLINNILDFSRIESGRKVYKFRDVDVGQVVAETLHTFKVRLKNSGFDIQYEAPMEGLPSIRIDRDAISQALCNLLDNAVKYSGEGRRITVRLCRDGATIILSVADQGIGISDDEQQKIFERFHRVSTGLIHDVKGSGLGLAIVTHIVEAHDGKVSVSSEPGRGSTFSIHLPIPREAVAAAPDVVDSLGAESHA